MFKTVGLVARYDKKPALKLAEELAEHLSKKGLKVFLEDTLEGKVAVKEAEMVSLSAMHTDFIITIGGDGTILRTCITVPKPEPPILAVNMGERGFLTEVEPKDACQAVDKILAGDYKIEECCKLFVSDGNETFPDALNDIVISAGEPAVILKAQICEDGKPILKVQADGLIISTPTGSTGYSLSAGGPVLSPTVDALVISAICPLNAFPSLVFPADSTLTFNVLSPKQVLVSIDGKYRRVVAGTDPLKITLSKHTTNFIRLESNFYDRLKSRLLFKGTQ